MKKKSVVLAGVLVLCLSFSPMVRAEDTSQEPEAESGGLGSLFEEDGLLGGLFGEDGTLSGIIPEDVDLGEVMNTVGEKLEDAGSTLGQTVEGVLNLVRDEDGSVNLEKAGDLLDDLFGMYSGDGGSDEELDEILRRYNELDEVMRDHLFERNAEYMDPGDVQIYSKQTAYMDDIDQDVIRVLADFTQDNYTIEGDQMIYLSGASEPLLLTLVRGEDGSITVTDEMCTEDGEGFDASLEILCEEVDLTSDDYYASMVFGAYNDADALAEYLEGHPEIVGAEYMGEIMTAAELRAMSEEYADSLFNSIFEETEDSDSFTP